MVWSAAIDRMGDRVLATYEDGTSRLWTVGVQGRFTLLDQSADQKAIIDGAFSPDGLHAVTVGQDGYARIWSTDGGRTPVVVSGPAPGRDWLERVIYSPDGSRIAFTSGDGRAWIIAADGSGSPRVLRTHDDLAHDGSISDIAYSEDGTWIATVGGVDDLVCLWRADGRERPLVLGRHFGTATRAAFLARGTRLASTSEDGTLRVWLIGWQDLLAFIRSRTSAALRIGERMLYLGESEVEARAACQVSELRFFRRHTCDEDPFNYGF
jgi:WD40 repeat protein